MEILAIILIVIAGISGIASAEFRAWCARNDIDYREVSCFDILYYGKPKPPPSPPFSSQVNHEIMQELSAEIRRRVRLAHKEGYILNKSVLHYCDELDHCLDIQLSRIKRNGPSTYKR